jgi:hypothetical protein
MTTDFTLERLLESKLALIDNKLASIDELIELKKPKRSSFVNGDELRSAQLQSVGSAPRKRRNRAKSKPTRGDGKAVCQFGCGFSAEDRDMSDSGKSLAVGNHHKAEHWADMRNAVLDWANQGKTQGDIAQLMVNRRWVGTNTAPKWTAQMIEQLTVPSLI